MKMRKIIISILGIGVLTLGVFLAFNFFKEPTIKVNLNKTLTTEVFEKALTTNDIDTITQILISEDAKNSYKNWLKNIVPNSEVDVFCKKSEFKFVKFNNGDKSCLDVKITSPDLICIVKDIVKKNGSVPPKDIMTNEVRKVLNGDKVPKKTANITVEVVKSKDGTYGMQWNEHTINLLSGNLLGSMQELEQYQLELLTQKMRE